MLKKAKSREITPAFLRLVFGINLFVRHQLCSLRLCPVPYNRQAECFVHIVLRNGADVHFIDERVLCRRCYPVREENKYYSSTRIGPCNCTGKTLVAESPPSSLAVAGLSKPRARLLMLDW